MFMDMTNLMPPILIWLFIEDSEYLQPYSSIHLKFSKNFYKDSSLKKEPLRKNT